MRKISGNLEKEILRKTAEGSTSVEITEWLLAEHGIKVSRQAVSNLLRKTQVERGDVAKAVVREELTKHVVSDLDVLSASLERVVKLETRLHAKAHRLLDTIDAMVAGETPASPELVLMASEGANDAADIALKASDRVKAIADKKLHYAGADEEGGDTAAAPPVDWSRMSDEDIDRIRHGTPAQGDDGGGRG